MPSMFKEPAAPYLLALIVTLVGWMLNSAIDNARDLRVVEVRSDRAMDGTVNTLTVRIRNASMTQAVNAGRFSFTCPLAATPAGSAPSECMTEMPSVGARAQFVGIGSVVVISPIDAQANKSAIADARIPPGSEVSYRFGVTSADTRLHFRYLLGNADIAGDKSGLQVKIIDRDRPAQTGLFGHVEDLTLFVISNYLSVLVLMILFLLGLIALWVLIASVGAALSRKYAPIKESEEYRVEITGKGETYVATVKGI